MKKSFKRGCKCETSFTVAETLSFGFGELDLNGFWERGCYLCARRYEDFCREKGRNIIAWPCGVIITSEILQELREKFAEELEEMMTDPYSGGNWIDEEFSFPEKVRNGEKILTNNHWVRGVFAKLCHDFRIVQSYYDEALYQIFE